MCHCEVCSKKRKAKDEQLSGRTKLRKWELSCKSDGLTPLAALLYRHVLGNRRTVAAGLLKATSLSFVVAAVQFGTLLGEISASTGAALIGAGLLSVMLFPLVVLEYATGRIGSKAKRTRTMTHAVCTPGQRRAHHLY